MCGRYSLFTPPDDLEERFDARFTFEFEPRYNAAPSQRLPVVGRVGPPGHQPPLQSPNRSRGLVRDDG